jgi:hypothetical protein
LNLLTNTAHVIKRWVGYIAHMTEQRCKDFGRQPARKQTTWKTSALTGGYELGAKS